MGGGGAGESGGAGEVEGVFIFAELILLQEKNVSDFFLIVHT